MLSLPQELNSVKSDLITDPGAYVQGKFSMDELMKLDKDQIREKIMPAAQTHTASKSRDPGRPVNNY